MNLFATVIGTGRPILLLPGFALDGAVMAAACEPAFRTATPGPGQWQRIYLDLPGTGGSPSGEPTSDAVLTAVTDTVTGLIGDAPFLLAGHSFGGYLATGLARRYPERIAGLLLICCGLRIRPADRDLTGVLPSTPEPVWLERVPADLQSHFTQAVGHQTPAVADRIAFALAQRGPLDEPYLDALRPAGYRLSDEPPVGIAARPAEGCVDLMAEKPVALLTGRRDRIAGYRDAFDVLAHYPGATVTVLPDAGHYLPFEQPEQFTTAVLDWLASATSR